MPPSAYAELQPLPGHRGLVDHLFILRDAGVLTGPQRSVFASPFCEVALLGRQCDDARSWQVARSAPRFGSQPRAAPLHGWLIGVRFDPLNAGLETLPQALGSLSDEVDALIACGRGFDAIATAIDRAIEMATTTRAPDEVMRWRDVLSLPETTVVEAAAAGGITPRTLQRMVRARTGLSPKQYASLHRYTAALHDVAGGDDSIAEVALAAGYCDQAHLSADLAQHTGSSPARLRAFARNQDRDAAARLFETPEGLDRVTLFVAGATDAAQPAG